MVYYHDYGVIKRRVTMLGLLLIAGLFAFLSAFGVFTNAKAAADINGCSFDQTASTWSLTSDCTSTAQIDIPAGITVEGNGFTISPNFTNLLQPGNPNNSVISIVANDVTINNLKIDGTNGTKLHGINVYVSDNIYINNSSIANNDRSGIVVNGSDVTVNNISTAGNGWHGINVDNGSGVTTAAVLTINGYSSHTDMLHIYVDNVSEPVSVIDTMSQYTIKDNPYKTGDRLYTLKDIIAPEAPVITQLLDSTSNNIPNNGVTSSYVVTAYWSTVSDAAKYEYSYWNDIPGNVWNENNRFTVEQTATSRSGEFNQGEGVHHIAVRAIDAAGNKSAWSNTFTVTYDDPSTLESKDECLNNGWKLSNKNFRNQGDCVSSFASKLQSTSNPDGNRNTNGLRTR